MNEELVKKIRNDYLTPNANMELDDDDLNVIIHAVLDYALSEIDKNIVDVVKRMKEEKS